MNRGSALVTVALALLGACGDSSSSPDAASGTPDAASYQGSWLLTSQTIGGTGTAAGAIDGALVLGATDLAFATAEPLGGILTTYTRSSDGKSFTLGDGTAVPFTLAPAQLTLQLPTSRTAVFAPDQSTAAQTVSVKGTITAPSPLPTYVAPRVALVFVLRGDPDFGNDPREDQPVTFSGSTAAFDIEVMRGALGNERITFGDGGVAIGFLVVYDDRNQDGKLGDLFAACVAAQVTTDCVLGMSPVILGYQDLSSPELTASPYGYLRAGWSNAVIVTDARKGGVKSGLVSLDGSKSLPFDVTLWDDPTAHSVVKLDLTVPVVSP